MANKERPIIIKKIYKKKVNHGHGGNWKVAYADFVTAMMVFFLLMWLLATLSPEQLVEIKDYFGSEEFEDKKYSSSTQESEASNNTNKNQTIQERILLQIKNQINNANLDNIVSVYKKDKNIIISLESSPNRELFYQNNDLMTENASKSLNYIAKSLNSLSYGVAIEVHNNRGEINTRINANASWDLSIARAKNTMLNLFSHGLRQNMITAITGHSDQIPKPMTNINDISNRRIDIVIYIISK